jgi:hypothetical protein
MDGFVHFQIFKLFEIVANITILLRENLDALIGYQVASYNP